LLTETYKESKNSQMYFFFMRATLIGGNRSEKNRLKTENVMPEVLFVQKQSINSSYYGNAHRGIYVE